MGGLADAFDSSKANWANEYQELKSLLSPDKQMFRKGKHVKCPLYKPCNYLRNLMTQWGKWDLPEECVRSCCRDREFLWLSAGGNEGKQVIRGGARRVDRVDRKTALPSCGY